MINIEIQNKNNYNIIERSEFYASSLYHNSLKEGMNFRDNIKTDEEAWLAYLSNQLNEDEIKGVFKMKRSIEEIDKIVKIVMEDKDVNDELNRRIFNEYDKRAALKHAEENGERKTKIELAKKMLEKGKSVEEIIELTELSKEEITNIAKLSINPVENI